MLTIDLNGHPAQQQYAGCGRAWVAVDDNGRIVAIRYMGKCPIGDDFSQYRSDCRRELARQGHVLSGMLSGMHFTFHA